MWNVTASISGPKSVVSRVSSLSFKTLLYDKIIVRHCKNACELETDSMTSLYESKCYKLSVNIFKGFFFLKFKRNFLSQLDLWEIFHTLFQHLICWQALMTNSMLLSGLVVTIIGVAKKSKSEAEVLKCCMWLQVRPDVYTSWTFAPILRKVMWQFVMCEMWQKR